MVIRSVTIDHVRSHSNTRVECSPSLTVLIGPNGSGKTSVLESISLCSMGRTFVPVPDLSLIQHGAEGCRVRVDAVSDNDVPYIVEVELRPGQRKRISTNHDQNISARELIGRMPVVALSPDLKSITFGGPAERRSFIDALMAQSSRTATDLLYEHRRVLKQRNALLQSDHVDQAGLQTWTEQFISLSTDLIQRRADFIAELLPLVKEEYAIVSDGKEEIGITYEPDHVDLSLGEVRGQLTRTAERLHTAERARKLTLFGPQKDDIILHINEGLVRENASQGQHKSFLIALKLAECRLLNDHCNERPIVLLDDLFSELDATRSTLVLQRVKELGMQCFVTETGERRAESREQRAESREQRAESGERVVRVESGRVH